MTRFRGGQLFWAAESETYIQVRRNQPNNKIYFPRIISFCFIEIIFFCQPLYIRLFEGSFEFNKNKFYMQF